MKISRTAEAAAEEPGNFREDRDALVPKPQFPFIEAGGWRQVLIAQTPEFSIDLPCGAFLWLWDLVENKATMIENMEARIESLDKEFRVNYGNAVICARDALRKAASHNYVVEAIGNEKRAFEAANKDKTALKVAPKNKSGAAATLSEAPAAPGPSKKKVKR